MNWTPPVLGLAGKMGSGKDTVGDILVERFGYRKISMAEALREECACAIRLHMAPMGAPGDILEIVQTEPDERAPWRKPTPPSMRRLLQWYGQHLRDACHADYLVRRMYDNLYGNKALIVIPDIRYANEAAMVRDFGGDVWLVRRNQSDEIRESAAHSHISERFCDEYRDWDATIQNHGTLEELRVRVSEIYRCRVETRRCVEMQQDPQWPAEELRGLMMGELDWKTEQEELTR